MIPEIGHFALALALMLALVQSVLPLMGAHRRDAALIAFAKPAALSLLVLVATAYAALTYSFIVSDFSVATVAANSHSAKPMLYKITGVWGNHEGSMLLWVLVLTLFGAAVAAFGRNLPPTLQARVLAIQAMIAAAFLAFILFTSNPFLRLHPAPLDGRGLNPLLQDPGLAFHPPMLYLGYVGFSMAFAFAVAALIEGRVDAAWARWVRPWTLAAWVFLTAGIALGSWWAYYELGWGGWWFWDPVENASFMPWLAGTALLHSAIVVEKRDALKSWTVLLAILTFGLSLMGTFIVRSGVLTSVHAFATDPARGIFILAILTLTLGGALTLYAVRAPRLGAGGLFRPVSREGALVVNNLLLAGACLTVFLGTLYPLALEAATGGRDKISVGQPYFNATFLPIMIPLIMAMAVGPMLAWKRGRLGRTLRRLAPAAGAAVLALIAAYALAPSGPTLAPFGMALAAWLFTGALLEWVGRIGLFRGSLGDTLHRLKGLPRSASGMTVSHMGLAVMIAGITASSAWQIEAIQVMRPGDTLSVGGYAVTFEGVGSGEGPNYSFDRAQMRVTRGGEPIALMEPERRFFPVAQQTTTEAAIRTTLFSDLYATLGEPDGAGGWTTRVYLNPLVPWLWFGALMMAAGGLASLTDRRHRVGAPARRAKPRAAPKVGAPAPAE